MKVYQYLWSMTNQLQDCRTHYVSLYFTDLSFAIFLGYRTELCQYCHCNSCSMSLVLHKSYLLLTYPRIPPHDLWKCWLGPYSGKTNFLLTATAKGSLHSFLRIKLFWYTNEELHSSVFVDEQKCLVHIIENDALRAANGNTQLEPKNRGFWPLKILASQIHLTYIAHILQIGYCDDILPLTMSLIGEYTLTTPILSSKEPAQLIRPP